MAQSDFLLVGLGNPGGRYETTRHNVGFIIVDELARRWGGALTSTKWDAQYCRLSHWGCRLTLVKPMTYMNRSGRSVAEFVRFFKLSPENIVVIHDDLDMVPGRLKLVHGGGAGGHNGIRSISQALGANNYFRLKVGIGRPGTNDVHPEVPVEDYVLSAMAEEELQLLDKRFDVMEQGLREFVSRDPARAMNLINCVK